MLAPFAPFADPCRSVLVWGAILIGTGCARFGYDILDGTALGPGGSGPMLPPQGGGGGAAGALLGAGSAGAPEGGSGAQPNTDDDAGGLVEKPGLDAAAPDAEPGGPGPCQDPLGFAPPVLLTGLPGPPLFGPALSEDGVTLYFASNGDLYSARRTSVSETTFGSVEPLAAVNSGLPELTPHLSPDGLTLYFARDSDGSGLFRDLMQSVRGSAADAFGAPTVLAALNDPLWSELSPALRSNGLELFFASSRPGGPGLFDIWRAQRANLGANFGNPQPLGGINSTADESGIAFSTNEQAAILSSARAGGVGARDLWIATRNQPQGAFGVSLNVAALNTAQNDTDPALRADERELIFASDRSGQSLLYSALRPCTR
jgi:Tol biopolymer transport system component